MKDRLFTINQILRYRNLYSVHALTDHEYVFWVFFINILVPEPHPAYPLKAKEA